MESKAPNRAAQYAVVISFGVLGGLALWYWGAPNAGQIRPDLVDRDRPPRDGLRETGDAESTALQYAKAVELGNCEAVIGMTWWMQERLQYVERTESTEEAVAAAWSALCEGIQSRTPEGNQLTSEGIEDQYLFQPGVTVSVVAVDDGREDLAKPVRERAWLRVEYPSPDRSLRDRTGEGIRSLRVGVNLSPDGYVLKSGVRGNVEIEWESITVWWTSEGGS